MEQHELTCIVCPMGCRITARNEGGQLYLSGNQCKRGEAYCRQEIACPVRVVTSLVAVHGAQQPLCPVKTASPVARAKIPEVLEALRALNIQAPVEIGDVLICDVAGSGADLVATAPRPAV
mgnify:CR=1 FL=1